VIGCIGAVYRVYAVPYRSTYYSHAHPETAFKSRFKQLPTQLSLQLKDVTMSWPTQIDFDDATLFGNDAAEDENQDVFNAYFVPRPEVDLFFQSSRPLAILRAYRGEGKSAIIRHVHQTNESKGIWSVKLTGSALSPAVESSDPNVWNREWQRSILESIAADIGRRIGIAWTDDAMSLVEEAERKGFKQRSLVSSILTRLKFKDLPELKEKDGQTTLGQIQRYLDDKESFWVFVDDVDEDFQNTDSFRQRVSSFYSACRNLSNAVPQLLFRSSIRPNVWRILRAHSESLSKVDQYAIDLQWDYPSVRKMLAKRIEGFLVRKGQQAVLDRYANQKGSVWEESLCDLIFESPMQWGYNVSESKPVYKHSSVVLGTLSRYRPRWLVELCRLASKQRTKSTSTISCRDITGVLREFGRERIEDLAAEYRSECPQVQDLINAFAGTKEDFTTDQLTKTITNRILNGTVVTMASSGTVTQPMKVAAFLYEIGFLTARRDDGNDEYTHYVFAEKPEPLHTRTNVDQGLSWEIHPVFRQVLGLRDDTGRKLAGMEQNHAPRSRKNRF
jgi:hypothetical protein